MDQELREQAWQAATFASALLDPDGLPDDAQYDDAAAVSFNWKAKLDPPSSAST